MSDETRPSGHPLGVDFTAESASAEVPGFLAKPNSAPVYHGFRLLNDVAVDGFVLGVITDFEAAESTEGDAFVVAPDIAALDWSGRSATTSSSRRYVRWNEIVGVCRPCRFHSK